MNYQIESSFTRLLEFLEKVPLGERYKGYDPFDGLNSKLFRNSFLNHSRLARLLWLQMNKQSPVNFRNITKTECSHNPQALGIFISAYCKLYEQKPTLEFKDTIMFLSDNLLEESSKGYSGTCWGYNFDWQARAFFQPKFTPMIVPTAFAVDGLLSAYHLFGKENYLEACTSSARFVLSDLNRTYEDDLFAFSYSPIDKTVVYNATLLASKLLAKIYKITKEDLLKTEAQKSIDFCLKHQNLNGSWTYGSKPYHQWIDNFHTGYNLVCLNQFKNDTNGNVPDESLKIGLDYYLNTFFENSGKSKYYNNKTYPIDINNPAQLVITLKEFGRLGEQSELVDRVLLWTIKNMQDPSGYFYYQVRKYYKIKIPYMRWSQSWMFLALATYLIENEAE